MASSSRFAGHSYAGLVIRVIGVAGCGCIAAILAAQLHHYATSALFGMLAAALFADLVRTVTRTDRLVARFVDGLAADGIDGLRPQRAWSQSLAAAIDRAATNLKAERAARQRQIDFLQALLDSVPAALIVAERSGEIVPINRAAHRLAGRDVASLDQIEQLGPAAVSRLRQLKPGRREILTLRDGREVLATAVQFLAGEPKLLVAIQDISTELDAVELKSWQDLVRVLTHEMMNSLTPIISLAESLQHLSPESKDVELALGTIARRGRGLIKFVDQYRKLSVVSQPRAEPINLTYFMSEFDLLMEPVAKKARVKYSSVVTPPALTIHADKALLEQALINLVKNAIESAARGACPQVHVACKNADGRTEIAIVDNGSGVPVALRHRLFVPFFTTKSGGSGIGLSLVRQIALAQGGRLEIRESPGGGAAFVLSLPDQQ